MHFDANGHSSPSMPANQSPPSAYGRSSGRDQPPPRFSSRGLDAADWRSSQHASSPLQRGGTPPAPDQPRADGQHGAWAPNDQQRLAGHANNLPPNAHLQHGDGNYNPPPFVGGGSQYSHHSHTGQTQHCGTTVRDGGYHDHVPERLGHSPRNEPATSHAHAHSDRSTKVGGRNGCRTQHGGTTVRGRYHAHTPEHFDPPLTNETDTSHALSHNDRSKVGGRKGESKRDQGKPRLTQLATMVTDDEGGEEDGEEVDPAVQLRPFHHHPPNKSPHPSILLKLLIICESTGLYFTERSRHYTTTKPTATKGDKFRRASSHTERNLKQVVYLLRKKGL